MRVGTSFTLANLKPCCSIRSSNVLFIAHHFKLADSVVILENSRIKKHGHWSVLDSLPDASGKVMSDDFHESGQVDAEGSQLDAQKKKAKELDTRLDLNRKTGNLSLYGKKARAVVSFSQRI